MVCIIACVGGNATHALVYFDEEKSSAVVSISKVSCESLEKGNECDVVWIDGNEYRAIFLVAGSQTCNLHIWFLHILLIQAPNVTVNSSRIFLRLIMSLMMSLMSL